MLRVATKRRTTVIIKQEKVKYVESFNRRITVAVGASYKAIRS